MQILNTAKQIRQIDLTDMDIDAPILVPVGGRTGARARIDR